MPHIPRAVCLTCNREMVTDKQGVLAEAIAGWGPYYKIHVDRLKCELCGTQVLSGWARDPAIEHFQDGYEVRKAEHAFEFSGEHYVGKVREGFRKIDEVLKILRDRVALVEYKKENAERILRREEEAHGNV